MKKVLLALLMGVFSLSISAQEYTIGKIINGVPTLTTNVLTVAQVKHQLALGSYPGSPITNL